MEARYPKFNFTGEWELVSLGDRQAICKERAHVRAGTGSVGQLEKVTLITEQFINISNLNEGLDDLYGAFVQGFAVLRKFQFKNYRYECD